MLDNFWYPKQTPLQGLTGLWGGNSSNLIGGGGALYNEPLLTNGTGITFRAYNSSGGQLKGYLGPVKSDLRYFYKYSQSVGNWIDDDDFFNTTTTGIQVWHVPEDATYRFSMESPSFHTTHGNASSTTGAAPGWKMVFDYDLTAGDRLFILPGQRCDTSTDGNSSFGGNGGTFLVKGDNTETNLDTDLLACDVADCLAVCGGAANQTNGASQNVGTPRASGSHPSGSDLETSVNYGSGRGVENYHGSGGGGPSGGAGFLRSAGQHDGTGTVLYTYAEKADGTSFVFDADCFVRGGRGGKGYANNTAQAQGNSGMNGSGGFGGGGGQSVGNSYSSGAGGMMGGGENDGEYMYPNSFKYANGADRIGSGSCYIKSGISLSTNTTTTTTIGKVNVTIV
tara:strand:+ start:337 stop:1521 length:1185 start_codon:yes stop_codon:yes gene_type:complete